MQDRKQALNPDQLRYIANYIATGYQKRNPCDKTPFELEVHDGTIRIISNTQVNLSELKSRLFDYVKNKFMPRISGRLFFLEENNESNDLISHLSCPMQINEQNKGKIDEWVKEIDNIAAEKKLDPDHPLIKKLSLPNFGLETGGFDEVKDRLEYVRNMAFPERDKYLLSYFLSPFFGVGPTARGMALLAHYHESKYQDKLYKSPIFVYGNLDDFCDKLPLLGHGPDIEIVMEVVCEQPLAHRMPLVFQRKDGLNCVVIMCSLADSVGNPYVKNITDEILHILPGTKILSCNERRQFGNGGCPTFTAKDAALMGRIPNFYEYITKDYLLADNSEKFTSPPRHISFIQSMSGLNKYLDLHPEVRLLPLNPESRKNKSETLEQNITLHLESVDGKIQNTKLNKRWKKLVKEIVKMMLTLDESTIHKIVLEHDGRRIDRDLLENISSIQRERDANKVENVSNIRLG